MVEEFNALICNGTWELVPSQPHQHSIGCKWVFRIKRHSDGTIDRYKARLVAKGYDLGLILHKHLALLLNPLLFELSSV